MAVYDMKYEIDESQDRFLTAEGSGPNDENSALLWNKHLTIYQEYSKFWKPRLEIARKCSRFERREIFTSSQKDYYENTLGKIVVEPQEMKPVINALMRQILLRVPSGTISMEDPNPPETAAKPEVVRVVLQWLKNQLKADRKRRSLLRKGLVVGMPQCLWFDLVSVQGGLAKELQATLLPWQGALPSPLFREEDGSDIEDLLTAEHRTKQQLLDFFPNREAALTAHTDAISKDPKHYITILQNQNNLTSVDRSTVLYNVVEQSRFDSLNGLYLTFQHTYPIETKQTIYFNEKAEHALFIPRTWEEWRKRMWLAAHPEYKPLYDQPVKTLWVTIFTADGFIWYNGPSWYQHHGELPCAWFVPSLVDEQPTGAAEDLLPYIFNTATAETEGLDQVRKGTGSTTFVREGTLRHPKYLGREQNKADGVVIIKKNAGPLNDTVQWRDRKPNDTYLQFADRQRDQMKDVHNVHPALMGQFGGRQSDKAKRTEIDMALGPNAVYVENFAQFNFQLDARLCSFFPYALNERTVVEIEDEYGKKEGPFVVNDQGYDYSGQAEVVANDLTSVEYRIEPVPGDDSRISREEQMREFVEMLEAFGNTLLQMAPMYMANVMQSFPNRFAREMGHYMRTAAEEQAQAQAREAQGEADLERMKQQTRTVVELMKVITPRLMMKTDAKDILEAPQGFQLFYQWWLQQQQQAQQIAASSAAMGGGGQGGMPVQPEQPAPEQPAAAPEPTAAT